jgi:hypothetical protein
VDYTNQAGINSPIPRTYWAPARSWYKRSLNQDKLADLDELSEEIQIQRIIEFGLQEQQRMVDTTQTGIKDSVIIQQQQEEIESLKAQVEQNRKFLEEQVEQNKKAEADKEKVHEKKLDKWLTKQMEEMVTEIMNSRMEATPKIIPIPETPQPQTRFSVPPTGPTPGQPKFATSTPYTAAYGRGNPETPHPQNIYGSSSAYNFEQSRTKPGYTP